MNGGNGDDGGDDATVFRPAGGGGTPTPPGFPPTSPGFGQAPPAAPGVPVSPPPGQPVSSGGAAQWGAPPPPPAAAGQQGGGRLEFAPGEPNLYGPEPVVAAAGRLILLANHIKTMAVGPDLESLRRTTVAELDAFTKRGRALGLEPKSVQLAHYILCAFIDDAVMSTPWGGQSQWSTQSLLVVYHKDARGGDRMFQFAEQMERDPSSEPRLIELLYLCLSLGFEGRAALDPRGQNVLVQRRAGLAALIQRQRAASTGEISPQWHGQKVASGRFGTQIPLWAVLAAVGVVALLIFAGLLMHLSSRGNAAIEAVDRAVGTVAVPPPPPPPAQAETPLYEKFQDILRPDVAAGRLELTREGNEIVIRLHNQGLFASAQADASNAWSDTFAHLAQAANLTKGPIKVEGHTDDQAIHSLQFPSNQELSEARAQSVAQAIEGSGLADASRMAIAGFGATQPIGDNASDEGRTRNRRVELRVENDINWR
jgi:type VI secretion system protein ImpK